MERSEQHVLDTRRTDFENRLQPGDQLEVMVDFTSSLQLFPDN